VIPNPLGNSEHVRRIGQEGDNPHLAKKAWTEPYWLRPPSSCMMCRLKTFGTAGPVICIY
jgi:hypothetical protein